MIKIGMNVSGVQWDLGDRNANLGFKRVQKSGMHLKTEFNSKAKHWCLGRGIWSGYESEFYSRYRWGGEIEEEFKWERKGPRQGNKIRNLFLAVEGSCLGF